MRSTEFIKNKLRSLVEEFPNIKVQYEFRENSLVHFVEVLPDNVYHYDENYADAEERIILDFISNFPDENICFISENSYVKIEHPSFELQGSKYIETFNVIEECPISISEMDVESELLLKVNVSTNHKRNVQVNINPMYCIVDCSFYSSPLAA